MNFDVANLYPVMPEIVLLTVASLVLVIDLFLKDEQRIVSYTMSQIGLVLAIAAAGWVGGGETQVVFDGSYVRDAMSDVLKIFLFITAMLSFVYSRGYLQDRGLFKGEYYVLGLFAVLGMSVMVSANNFLVVYLGLELLALCLYAMVAFDRDSRQGSEAAMKYFVLGALASGMLLYGISMIYGATGSIQFNTVAQAVAAQGADNKVLVFGLVFLVIGLAFKFGAVPFHMWVPDVYHGAPTAVALFLGSVPKIAAFALAIRILVDGLEPLHADWQGMLVILALLSMGLGNVIAIAQTNIKRMLAYSTISHVGFIFLGILSASPEGYGAAMFYAIVYALMAAGGFGMVILLSRQGFEAENIEDFKGLNERSSWYAAMMALLMFSMAGVPPTVGFLAKLVVLKSVIGADLVWVAAVGVFFSIIGAFYYLRIIKLMYFDKPVDSAALTMGGEARVVLSINGIAMLLLGLFPAGLMGICRAAFG
jgi:NADH-quinone oxidoreductase subunit N